MALDIDDGTTDGNRRTLSGSDYFGDTKGDGEVDMSDFRRYRDWFLWINHQARAQAQPQAYLDLDGDDPKHPKKDPNGDGEIDTDLGLGAPVEPFPQGDFNGDGNLHETDPSLVPGYGERTDFEMLAQLFKDLDAPFANLKDDGSVATEDARFDAVVGEMREFLFSGDLHLNRARRWRRPL